MPQFCVAICSPDNKYLPVGTWRKIWKYPVLRSSAPMHGCFPRVTSKVESDREPSFRHHCRVNSDTVKDHGQPREDLAVFPGVPRYYRDSKLFRGDMAGDPSESTSRRSISFLSERGRSCWLNTVEDHVCDAIHDNDPMGLDRFRDAICSYLRTARAVECDPSQIMIVSGSQQALEITARVLLDPGDPVWIEEPGYQLARSVLLGAGCRIVPVPVDDEGIDVSAGVNLLPKARAAFVTPSHQYPLGVTMSVSRRLRLLDWARDNGAWIVEDDYDGAYRYDTTSVSSLQGIDSDARVIYIGTFSRVIFPSVRVSYIVIPPDLIERFMAVRFSLGIFPSYLFQEVLTDFIRAGRFARHIRRMRALYKERRTALVESVQNTCRDMLEIHGAGAGMHLTVTLPSGFNDAEIASQAAKYGLCLWPLSPCYMNKPRHGFVLGFAATPADQMAGAVHQLWRLLKKQPGQS